LENNGKEFLEREIGGFIVKNTLGNLDLQACLSKLENVAV
jgi:hypothetical protein